MKGWADSGNILLGMGLLFYVIRVGIFTDGLSAPHISLNGLMMDNILTVYIHR
jgi:hypothetical protein